MNVKYTSSFVRMEGVLIPTQKKVFSVNASMGSSITVLVNGVKVRFL